METMRQAEWSRLVREWEEARRSPGADPGLVISRAVEILARAGPGDWRWLATGLQREDTKWFAASVLCEAPFPRALLGGLARAAVQEDCPSSNRAFIDPGVRAFGSRPYAELLFGYLERGSSPEKAGAASAFYWCFGLHSGGDAADHDQDITDLRIRYQETAVREFVRNQDLEVRRRILPGIDLRVDLLEPPFLAPAREALRIARASSDEYLRHRAEIQAGGSGLLRPIPGDCGG